MKVDAPIWNELAMIVLDVFATIEEVPSCVVEIVIQDVRDDVRIVLNSPVPATSKRNAGVVTPIPTGPGKYTCEGPAVKKDVLSAPKKKVDGPRKTTLEAKVAPAGNTGAPRMLLVAICCVEKEMPRMAPATSKGTVGAAIWIPTLELVVSVIAGVTFEGTVGQSLELTPGSKTMDPVVCIRMRSEALEPRNITSSWVVAPVDSSAITVFE